LLAVQGEGSLPLPAHRQASLQMPPLLHGHDQSQGAVQESVTQRQRQAQADPSSQLWLIPELQKLQPAHSAGASQAPPVSFVNTKPQQRRHTRQQQQHDAFYAEQQQQQQQLAVSCAPGDAGRSVQGLGLGGGPASSWGQFSQPSQWDSSRSGRPGVLLPQLPAGSLRGQQHRQQQQLLLSADTVPWASSKPARRLSSSDPGSAALRQAVAVAGTRAAAAGAVQPPAVGSHSGSGHVTVVELPQLATLRVADAVQ
jgi:hypothetical protein